MKLLIFFPPHKKEKHFFLETTKNSQSSFHLPLTFNLAGHLKPPFHVGPAKTSQQTTHFPFISVTPNCHLTRCSIPHPQNEIVSPQTKLMKKKQQLSTFTSTYEHTVTCQKTHRENRQSTQSHELAQMFVKGVATLMFLKHRWAGNKRTFMWLWGSAYIHLISHPPLSLSLSLLCLPRTSAQKPPTHKRKYPACH